MNKRSTPSAAPEPFDGAGAPVVDHHRTTTTGQMLSYVFHVQQAGYLVDGNGEMWPINENATLLVLDVPFDQQGYLEKLLDRTELTLHHTYGMRPAGERTFTPTDIRTKGRQDSSDDIPF